MKRSILFFLLIAALLVVVGVEKRVSAETTTPTSTITYTASTDTFTNPERGFYHFLQKNSGDNSVWSSTTFQTWRTTENISLAYCAFELSDFVTAPISDEFLTTIENNLAAIRDGGIKCILRFAYIYPSSTTLPPYGDADKEQILEHIAQLEPIIDANSDVILVWQAGFIGLWGEWYYTDHFADVDEPWVDIDHAGRYDVLSAMLDALTLDRMVQVRYPHAKIEFPGFNDTPLPSANAFDASNRARIGFHNDCFLASDTDFGTYRNFPESLLAQDKAFMAAETQFLPMGGETCNVNEPRSQCPTALLELAQFHYTYLNTDYEPNVLTSWDDDDCLGEIVQALGYRLVLTDGTYQDAVRPGDALDVAINLVNAGYAAPINPRPVQLVLSGSGGVFSAELNTDIRTWSPESSPINLTESLQVPSCVPAGSYDLLLQMPDADSTLATRPEYAIRLANTGVWQPTTGSNDLGIDITVSASATSNDATITGSFSSATCVPTAVTVSTNSSAAAPAAVLIASLSLLLAATVWNYKATGRK